MEIIYKWNNGVFLKVRSGQAQWGLFGDVVVVVDDDDDDDDDDDVSFMSMGPETAIFVHVSLLLIVGCITL